jgi:hypothetical protein
MNNLARVPLDVDDVACAITSIELIVQSAINRLHARSVGRFSCVETEPNTPTQNRTPSPGPPTDLTSEGIEPNPGPPRHVKHGHKHLVHPQRAHFKGGQFGGIKEINYDALPSSIPTINEEPYFISSRLQPPSSSTQVSIPKSIHLNTAFKGLKPIKLRLLGIAVTLSSGINTALSNASLVIFNSSTFPELSSFFNLYDMVRIINQGILFHPYVSVAAAATSAGIQGAIGIDADTTVGAPSTINTVLESSHSYGPFWITNTLQPSQNVSAYKQLQYSRVPALSPVSTADSPGGSWFPIADNPVTAINLFSVITNMGALGTSGQTSLSYYPYLDVEMKMRT